MVLTLVSTIKYRSFSTTIKIDSMLTSGALAIVLPYIYFLNHCILSKQSLVHIFFGSCRMALHAPISKWVNTTIFY